MIAPPLTMASGPAPRTHQAPDTQPAVQEPVAPGLVRVAVAPDATYVAGRLSARDTATATRILDYLRERGVLVVASDEDIYLVIARPLAPTLFARVTANAALLRAALACPKCQRRHSLSPPYGWCAPCVDAAPHDGPCAFARPVESRPQVADDTDEKEEDM